ncbi:uncharacterized protein METZ01_LOCUS41096 [marine metagenome]|uniref:Uncharacterized protein n=1 Tax=marine metagenome TaxID=408172 RepID=A0A381R977_9ZZZZ
MKVSFSVFYKTTAVVQRNKIRLSLLLFL